MGSRKLSVGLVGFILVVGTSECDSNWASDRETVRKAFLFEVQIIECPDAVSLRRPYLGMSRRVVRWCSVCCVRGIEALIDGTHTSRLTVVSSSLWLAVNFIFITDLFELVPRPCLLVSLSM